MVIHNRFGNFYLVEKMKQQKRGDWLLASVHWSWSITWRWALYLHPYRGTKLGFHVLRNHQGQVRDLGLNTKLGCFWFSIQDNMRRESNEVVI